MKNTIKIIIIAALALAASSCEGTWLMYDTEQTPHLYFKDNSSTHIYSFALLSVDTIRVETTVQLVGTVSDRDREFKLEYVPLESDTLTISTGSVTYPVIDAVEGSDFEVGTCVLPAGETSATVSITLRRQPAMLDSCLVRVGLQITPTEDFEPWPADSSVTSDVKTPKYIVYVNDGEPACPLFWRYNRNAELGWDYSLGNYYPAKFRKMLEFYHACEQSNPIFYEYCVERYGENLDAEPSDDNNNMLRFWVSTYSAAWAEYVFMPLYEYYEAYYAAHPDDPNYEEMGTVNLNARTGWANPFSGTYGFFN